MGRERTWKGETGDSGQTKLGVRTRHVDAREALSPVANEGKLPDLASNEPGLRRRKYAVGLRTRQVYDAGSTLSVFERYRSTTPEARCRSLNATGQRRRKHAVGL